MITTISEYIDDVNVGSTGIWASPKCRAYLDELLQEIRDAKWEDKESFVPICPDRTIYDEGSDGDEMLRRVLSWGMFGGLAPNDLQMEIEHAASPHSLYGGVAANIMQITYILNIVSQ